MRIVEWKRQRQRVEETRAESGRDKGREWKRQGQRVEETRAESGRDKGREWKRQRQRVEETKGGWDPSAQSREGVRRQ
jgi:hypothetical protein